MASNWRDWGKSLGQNALFTVLWALIPGVAVTYLSHIRSVWARPALEGLGASAIVLVSAMAVKAAAHLPPRRIMPGSENIESCVRCWLDNYKVAVKNDPTPDAYFRLRITLDSGLVLTVIRSRTDYPDYVQILCDLGIRGNDVQLLNRFSEDDKADILVDIKVELARAGMAYSGLVDPPEHFNIFRRIPIQHNLTEFIFMSMVGSVEAARNLVLLMFVKARLEMKKREKTASGPPELGSQTT